MGLLHHPFWLQLVFALFGLYYSTFYTSCLTKDHWRGFSTRNAHMVHIVNLFRLKWCIHLSRSLYLNLNNLMICPVSTFFLGREGKGSKYREPVSFAWHQNLNIIMDTCGEYARRWALEADVEIDTLSEWNTAIDDLLKRRIRRLKHFVKIRNQTFFCYPEVVRKQYRLDENFVLVSTDNVTNNYTLVC